MPDSYELFKSKSDPIPEIRRDIDIIPIRNNGNSYLYFHDSLGYATPDFALDRNVAGMLSLLDGRKSVHELSHYLGDEVTADQLLEYIRFLDGHRLLQSPNLKKYGEQIEQQYEASDTHKSVTAGFSYPADPKELRDYLDDAFSKYKPEEISSQEYIKALYAPHIDPRVGIKSYVKAFASIRDLKPKRVVILATSHYAGLYADTYNNKPFIVSSKHFEMPMGTIASDREAISELLKNSRDMGLTPKDRAHRIEHSIELHLLFLSYLWKHEFQIIPILVSGLDELFYMDSGHRSQQVEALGNMLQNQLGTDKETFFLISGDLAHVGKKFGDQQPARDLFNEVKSFDKLFMEHAIKGDEQKILNLMKEKYDPYRICGFPPLYTFLKSMPNLKGRALSYDLWDETARESAVTFASILYEMERG